MNNRLFSALVLALSINLAPAAVFAHAFLDSADPKVGSVVTAPPQDLKLQFTQKVEPAFSHIELLKNGKDAVELSSPVSDPSDASRLIVSIKGALQPGLYEVRWNIVSVDTHRTNGHFKFTYQP